MAGTKPKKQSPKRKPDLRKWKDAGDLREPVVNKAATRINCKDCANYVEPRYCQHFNIDLHTITHATKCKEFVVSSGSLSKYMRIMKKQSPPEAQKKEAPGKAPQGRT